MKNLLHMLSQTALFKGFTQEEVASALLCLDGKVKEFARKQKICDGHEPLTAVGLLLSGFAYVSKETEIGGQVIYYEASEGDIIGEASLLAASALHEGEDAGEEDGAYGLNVIAADACEILFIETKSITRAGQQGNICALRGKIIENLLGLIVASNKGLHRKLDLVSHRSLRSRIMHYLQLQARRQRSKSFQIPFSRADFADYLLVDRSALSRELCRMAEDGLITFSRNRFELLEFEQAVGSDKITERSKRQ